MSIPLVLVLWDDFNFAGRRRYFVNDTPSLSQYEFDNATKSFGVHPGPDYESWKAAHGGQEPRVTLYEHDNKGGASASFTAGAYPNWPALKNFLISSVAFNADAGLPKQIAPIPLIVELFQDINFGGKSVVIVENIAEISRYLGQEWHDRTSSARIRRGPNYTNGSFARLFRNPNDPRGLHIDLGVGDYPDLGRSNNFENDLDAIEIVHQ